jgi:hypothetical protein
MKWNFGKSITIKILYIYFTGGSVRPELLAVAVRAQH